MLAALLEQAVLPAELQRTLLERAGGNPLYAEEFVRWGRARLLGLGRAAQAAQELSLAGDIFTSLGAGPLAGACDDLLAQATALTS